jgi:para-nitrobenzyl esterase
LIYVFGYPPALANYVTEAPWRAYHDVWLGDTIRTYWTNFAKTGNPNGAGLPVCPAFDADSARVLELGDAVAARAMPHKAAHELMDAYMATMRAAQPR